MTATLRKVIAVLGAALCLWLAGVAYFFQTQASTFKYELDNLQALVEQQNAQATERLAVLTAERDAKQAALDEQRRIQEDKDADAKRQIAHLTDELSRRPIRVRVQPASGGSGGGSTGPPTGDTHAGSGDGTQTHGLLPEANARRLGEVMAEMEQVNAAYASCRGQLFSLHETLR